MRKIVISFLLVCTCGLVNGQYFQFSQYNFTRLRINPATTGISDYATAGLIYRNQNVGGETNLSSSNLELIYPILSRSGVRWSGLGVSITDDRFGVGGIYNMQEIASAYAINVPLTKFSTLSVGFKGLYNIRGINTTGFYTGSQFVPGRGFIGESAADAGFEQVQKGFFTMSFGGYYQAVDRLGNTTSYLGFSFFDFNNPNTAFLGQEFTQPGTRVASLGFRIPSKNSYSVMPELLYTGQTGNHLVNIGATTRLVSSKDNNKLDLITKYVVGRSGILGFQWHTETYSLGFSYDFPVLYRNPGNVGAVEVSFLVKSLVSRSQRNKSQSKKPSKVSVKPVTKTTKFIGEGDENGLSENFGDL